MRIYRTSLYREEALKDLVAGRRILLAGYGREGQSMHRLLRQLDPTAEPAIAEGNDTIARLAASGRYDTIVKSPGVPLAAIGPTSATITSLTDIFMRVYGDLVIGITGTKGKSTTASLIAHLIPGSILAGNIGIPLFDIADRLTATSVVVAELSCHQLEVLHRSPHIAVMLNYFQEHLDHYPDYEAYKIAKLQIGLHQSPSDHLFYCTDNAELRSAVEGRLPHIAALHPYSLASASPAELDLLTACRLSGSHNLSNALVACRVAQLVCGSLPEATRLATFGGLRHRLELVSTTDGRRWVDDSISTIPEATLAAVEALGHVDALILGGMDRGIDYSPLLRLPRMGAVAFVGAAGQRMHTLLRQAHCEPAQSLVSDDYAAVVTWCAEHTPVGGTVLLSPAAASYDQFRNFEHRGDTFAALAQSQKPAQR